MTTNRLLERFPELQTISVPKQQQLTDYFANAPDWLIDYITLEYLQANVTFVREGDPACMIYLLAKGTVKAVDYRFLGVEYDFMQFDQLCSMGGMEVLMDRHEYCTTLRTGEDSLLLKIPREAFRCWVMSDIETLKHECKAMGEYLLEQGRQSRALLFLSGPERLASILAHKYETQAQNGLLRISGNQQELANESGFNIKTVARALKSLEQSGIITRQHRSILINQEQYRKLTQLISTVVAPDTLY